MAEDVPAGAVISTDPADGEAIRGSDVEIVVSKGAERFTVDASMVDPDDFMRVLRFFRPQLVDH